MTIATSVLGVLEVQFSDDNAAWTTFGAAQGLGSILRSRRFGLPPGQSITARYWRVVVIDPNAADDWPGAVVSLDTVAMWLEGPIPASPTPNVKLLAFNFDDDSQRYIMPVTAGNIDVWHDSEFMCPVIGPWADDQVYMIARCQMLDTMVAFHQQVPPWRIMRQGGHYDWDSRALAFDSLPIYDYTGLEAGGVDEVQELFWIDYAAGDTFNITLESQVTAPIAWNASMATLAASVQAALIALPGVGAGQVTCAADGTTGVLVTFEGTMGNALVGIMAPVTLHSTAGGVSVAEITEGKPGGEPIISAARGWPAAGCFYQQRLYMVGLEGLPETVLGSQIGAYFSFSIIQANAAGAIDENLDTDEVTAARAIFAGRDLQIFTNSAEFYFPLEPITPPAPIKLATKRGIAPGIAPVMCNRTTIFVGPQGDSLYEFEFMFYHNNYEATPISVCASHIVNGIIDMSYRKHLSTSEPDVFVMPRTTGAAAVCVALRDQEITGFVPWATNGAFLAAAAELGGDTYVVVSRVSPAGAAAMYLERLDAARLLDCSILVGATDPTLDGLVMSGIPLDDGFTVTLYIDGADAGDVIVTGGAVTLPYGPNTSVEAGLNFTVAGTSLPFVFQQDPRGGAAMRPFVGDVEFRLGPTANLSAGIAGGTMWRVPLKTRPNALLDQGPGESAFTGWTRLQFVPGFQNDAQVSWAQTRPGPLTIMEIVATAST
ncbi:MAG TPA: hypothetical protein VFC47_11280 [Caulobacteraceae bacterium]|nr:hypothetical protein [Caulobacteraceae bacterium]